MIELRSPAEIQTMREAGRVVATTLRAVAEAARPGVRLIELDDLAATSIAEAGAKPSFLGYHPSWAPMPYPAVVCLSVNDAIVHGIPDDRVLREGDLLSIDCGAHIDGYHGDSAITIGVGTIDEAAQRLSDTTRRALEAGIAAMTAGGRLGDVSNAIETVARTAGYGLPDGFGGHGIGTSMHADPHVANTGRPGRGVPLREGLVLAIEPMLIESGKDRHHDMASPPATRQRRLEATLRAPDGWTVLTRDGSRAAHWEHSVAITAEGPVILTLP